jgi:hypothetical protein
VRVRFPDGTQVQGTFNAGETVGDIYQFIKEQLDSQDLAFQLRMSFYMEVTNVNRSRTKWPFDGHDSDDPRSRICSKDIIDVQLESEWEWAGVER